jgi:hypothetical protein
MKFYTDKSDFNKIVFPAGDHKVTVTQFAKGKSENKGTLYFLLRFENQFGYIDSRFYITSKSEKIISKLFESVQIQFKGLNQIDAQLKELLNRELLITVVEKVSLYNGKEKKFREASKFRTINTHTKMPEQYFTKEVNFVYIEEKDGRYFIWDEFENPFEVFPEIIDFNAFEEGEKYCLNKYNEYTKERSSFDIKLYQLNTKDNTDNLLLMDVSWNWIRYHDRFEYKNGSLPKIPVSRLYYDRFSTINGFEDKIYFHTYEAAVDYIREYNNEKFNIRHNMWAEILSDEAYSRYQNKNLNIENAFENKHYSSENSDDTLNFGFEGDPENYWNID